MCLSASSMSSTILILRMSAKYSVSQSSSAASLIVESRRCVRGCSRTHLLDSTIRLAADEDWDTEYLALILNIRIVDDMDEALRHIEAHGSQHSEAIVTNNHKRAMQFLSEVDAAAVFVNASTRLHDGGQFGLGAEIGISTTRIHARGPMGLEELTSMKFIVLGDGQLRE